MSERIRDRVVGGLIVAGLAGACSVGAVAKASGARERAEYRDAQRPAVVAALEKDGFKIPVVRHALEMDNTDRNMAVMLDLGNCAITVSAQTTVDANNNVTDVHNYLFTSQRAQMRDRVIYTFENQLQLTAEDILGPEPCETHALPPVPTQD